jgi:hypothetical protein
MCKQINLNEKASYCIQEERGPLSLVNTTEELLDRKVAALVYKIEYTAIGIRHADHVAPSIRKKLAISSPTSGGRSVGIVCLRTQTMEFFFLTLFRRYRFQSWLEDKYPD